MVDSGGYNLKTGAGSMIELMKFDMGGCAAVLGCAKAISLLKPNVYSVISDKRIFLDIISPID